MALRDRARQWLDGMPWRAQRQRAEPVGPRLLVMGVGGAGGNAVNNMIEGGLSGVAFCAVNTDLQALEQSLARRRLQIGPRVTRGLGAGARVEMGRMAAEESIDEIKGQLKGVDVVFITAGMGGGTGTGAAPVIARVARHLGILTVAVVTKPFRFEGDHRLRLAEGGIEEMQLVADTLVVIPNENLFGVSDAQTTFAEAFRIADNVLHAAVRGISDLMVKPGLVNLDFADIRTVMTEMGQAMTATGAASGENRAIAAAEAAISNPLIEDCSMRGARSVLVNVIGGPDLTLFEVNEAVSRIRAEADRDANIIFGSSFEKKLAGTILINVVATGIGPEGRGGEWQVRRIEERGEAASGDAATMEPPASEIAGEPQPDRHDAAGVSTKAKAAVLGIAAVCLIGAVGFALLSGAGSEAPAPAPQADAAASAPDLVADAAPPPAAQDGLQVVAEVAAEPPSSGSSMPVNSGELGVVVEPPVAEVLPTALPAPTVAKATPPAERHARSGYRLQLGAFRSETAAQAEVRRIQRVHGAILDRSEGTAKRIEIADRGSLWRVRIGPIAERSTAERLCDALKRHQTDCLLVETASAAPAVR